MFTITIVIVVHFDITIVLLLLFFFFFFFLCSLSWYITAVICWLDFRWANFIVCIHYFKTQFLLRSLASHHELWSWPLHSPIDLAALSSSFVALWICRICHVGSRPEDGLFSVWHHWTQRHLWDRGRCDQSLLDQEDLEQTWPISKNRRGSGNLWRDDSGGELHVRSI